MSDEIKEILEILGECNNSKYEYFGEYISLYQLGLLLDYIYNLQEEKEDYKSRCEKAIEWVKKNMYYFPRPDELLNILTGGDTSVKD